MSEGFKGGVPKDQWNPFVESAEEIVFNKGLEEEFKSLSALRSETDDIGIRNAHEKLAESIGETIEERDGYTVEEAVATLVDRADSLSHIEMKDLGVTSKAVGENDVDLDYEGAMMGWEEDVINATHDLYDVWNAFSDPMKDEVLRWFLDKGKTFIVEYLLAEIKTLKDGIGEETKKRLEKFEKLPTKK